MVLTENSVYDVEYDRDNFIAYLSAKKVPWSELDGRMIIEYGQVSGPDTTTATTTITTFPSSAATDMTAATALHRRGFKDFKNKLKGELKEAKNDIKKGAEKATDKIEEVVKKNATVAEKVTLKLDKMLGKEAKVFE